MENSESFLNYMPLDLSGEFDTADYPVLENHFP